MNNPFTGIYPDTAPMKQGLVTKCQEAFHIHGWRGRKGAKLEAGHIDREISDVGYFRVADGYRKMPHLHGVTSHADLCPQRNRKENRNSG